MTEPRKALWSFDLNNKHVFCLSWQCSSLRLAGKVLEAGKNQHNLMLLSFGGGCCMGNLLSLEIISTLHLIRALLRRGKCMYSHERRSLSESWKNEKPNQITSLFMSCTECLFSHYMFWFRFLSEALNVWCNILFKKAKQNKFWL